MLILPQLFRPRLGICFPTQGPCKIWGYYLWPEWLWNWEQMADYVLAPPLCTNRPCSHALCYIGINIKPVESKLRCFPILPFETMWSPDPKYGGFLSERGHCILAGQVCESHPKMPTFLYHILYIAHTSNVYLWTYNTFIAFQGLLAWCHMFVSLPRMYYIAFHPPNYMKQFFKLIESLNAWPGWLCSDFCLASHPGLIYHNMTCFSLICMQRNSIQKCGFFHIRFKHTLLKTCIFSKTLFFPYLSFPRKKRVWERPFIQLLLHWLCDLLPLSSWVVNWGSALKGPI